MLCPRCDFQGEVKLVMIVKTGEKVRLCDECDALWQQGDKVDTAKFTDFSTFVAPFGLQGTWDEIQVLED